MGESRKNGEIECLRAIAILFVLLHHSPYMFNYKSVFPAWFSNNAGLWTGVDLFFVISGFLITRSLYPLYDQNNSRCILIKKYLVKRVFRLLPAAWLWIAIPLLFSVFFAGQGVYPPFTTVKNDVLAALFQIVNIYNPYCVNNGLVGRLCSMPMVLGHFWSLSLEEQFYIVLPLLMVFLPRRAFFFTGILIIVTGFLWQRPAFSYGWHNRIDGLVWGVLIAHLYPNPSYSGISMTFLKYRPIRWLVGGSLVLGLAYLGGLGGLSMVGFKPPWTPAIGFIALTSASLVFFASFNRGYLIGGRLLMKPLEVIGARSYSLYLSHIPLMIISGIFADSFAVGHGMRTWLVIIVAILLISIATEITYRWVETPARLYGQKLAARILRVEKATEFLCDLHPVSHSGDALIIK